MPEQPMAAPLPRQPQRCFRAEETGERKTIYSGCDSLSASALPFPARRVRALVAVLRVSIKYRTSTYFKIANFEALNGNEKAFF